jgi:hypothetical protein
VSPGRGSSTSGAGPLGLVEPPDGVGGGHEGVADVGRQGRESALHHGPRHLQAVQRDPVEAPCLVEQGPVAPGANVIDEPPGPFPVRGGR